MKILMLTASYPPRIDGGGRHVQLLSKQLVRRGHKVIVFTVGYRDLPKYEEENGVEIHRFSGLFQYIPFLFKDTAQKWPEILHAHGRMVLSILPPKRDLRLPMVTTLQSFGLVCPKTTLLTDGGVCDQPLTSRCLVCGRGLYGTLKSSAAYFALRRSRRVLASVNKFIAVSSFVKQVHVKCLSLAEDSVAVIPNFSEPVTIEESRSGSVLPDDFMLFVGALTPVKGIDVLLDAYRRLVTRTKLVLIGAKRLGHRYQGTKDIVVIENASREVVTEAYRRCRFAVFPSVWPEPFGIVLIEAMSHAKAVIASKTGGITDVVVDQQTGLLVPPKDSESLSRAIRYLLENPEVAAEMGCQGFERWRQFFSFEAVVPRVEDVYAGVLEGTK